MLIITILLIVVPLVYLGLMYFSATSAKFSFLSVSFPGVTDLVGAITSRQLDLDLYFKIEGHGFVSIPVKSLQGQVYLEDVYIGNIKSTEPLQIPASGTTTGHVLVHLDFNAISAANIQDVVNSLTSHNYEAKFGFNGYVEPVVMFFPITVPLQHNMFMLTLSDAPQVSAISWDSPSVNVGEPVGFHVTVKNVFRGSSVNGVLDQDVREDVAYGSDMDARIYHFTVQLSPGESRTFSDTFTPYKRGSTRGFFLKSQWGTKILAEQESNYPPRLQVREGNLTLASAYWKANGVTTTTSNIGDQVEAHIVVSAIGGPVEDSIRAKIRKDISSGLDTDFKIVVFNISLATDQSAEYTVTFTPDAPSGGRLHGYFVEIEGSLSWTMPSSYPPRLTVTQTEGNPLITNVWWTINNQIATVAQQGETVTAHVLIKAEGGTVNGNVTVHVRKDLALLPDQDCVIQSFSLSLSKDDTAEFTVTFTASDKSGLTFRGYFVQVDLQPWNNTWTMDNSYPPRLNVN